MGSGILNLKSNIIIYNNISNLVVLAACMHSWNNCVVGWLYTAQDVFQWGDGVSTV